MRIENGKTTQERGWAKQGSLITARRGIKKLQREDSKIKAVVVRAHNSRDLKDMLHASSWQIRRSTGASR